MSRSLRLEYSGAWYHVMNRGVDRKNIFNDALHFQLFYDLLGEAHDQFGIEIHAYCLMNNHYHLLIRTPNPNLSKAMHHINGTYSQRYNKMINRDGPLFRGRYKAILVEAENYLLQLTRYIHLNPVKANLVSKPEDYLWSSYMGYLNENSRAKWLHCGETLSRFNFKDPVKKYMEFINQNIDLETEKFFKRSKLFPIFGSEVFVQKINAEHLSSKSYPFLPDYNAIKKKCLPSVDEIIDAVSKHFKIDIWSIKRNLKRTAKNKPRNISIYLAHKYSSLSRKEIANYFEGISYLSISSVSRNISLKLRHDQDMICDMGKIKNNLLL